MKVLKFLSLFICMTLFSLYSEESIDFKSINPFDENVSLCLFNNKNNEIYIDKFIRKKDADPHDHSVSLFHPVIDSKMRILEAAKDARMRANESLEHVEDLLKNLTEIKDWRLKDRLKELISASIGTVLIPDPKVKFLAVALALFTDLIINEGLEKTQIAYNIFIELSRSAFCLEEFQYYCRLSFNADEEFQLSNDGWKYTNFAIDSLTYADMLTASLEYKLHGAVISNHITKLREALMEDMIKNRKLTYGYLTRMRYCLENFDEIIAECTTRDRILTQRIKKNLEEAFGFLKLAKIEFGNK